ncbi:radical SAM family heme chaperone HemW [Desertibaculum subflavum]|uniref:radical SAM family heme chaperone HemW n=1 Tax=Desertibaculum subflavum TaxID=2268458 RepID=UPI000E66BEEA
MDAPAPLALYVHWPFCRSKCPYCDFNSHVRESVDQARWRLALLAELEHFAARTGPRQLTSIFFGGGTPSLMPPETAAALIARAAKLFPPAPDLEVTLEANPTSVEAGRFAAFRAAGVNRVSLGVQSLDPEALRFLGRQHDAREARAAVELARRHFPRFSFDLIYARPEQSEAEWRGEFREAVSLAGEHLSLYQLTIEANTGFAGAVKRGEWAPLDEAPADRLYEVTQALCEGAGLPAYEISNHARPGAECRHNLTYWRYGEYIGIGPGAHGRIVADGARHATAQMKKPEAWLEAVEAQSHATETDTALSSAEQAEEALMMGLRLSEGIDKARFRAATGVELQQAIDRDNLRRLIDGGFVEDDATRIVATPAGRRVLDAVLARLMA